MLHDLCNNIYQCSMCTNVCQLCDREGYGFGYLLVSQRAAEHVHVFPRIAHELSLEEGHVEARGIIVDKLEEEHLHGQLVLVLQVSLWDFCNARKNPFTWNRRQSEEVLLGLTKIGQASGHPWGCWRDAPIRKYGQTFIGRNRYGRRYIVYP